MGSSSGELTSGARTLFTLGGDIIKPASVDTDLLPSLGRSEVDLQWGGRMELRLAVEPGRRLVRLVVKLVMLEERGVRVSRLAAESCFKVETESYDPGITVSKLLAEPLVGPDSPGTNSSLKLFSGVSSDISRPGKDYDFEDLKFDFS